MKTTLILIWAATSVLFGIWYEAGQDAERTAMAYAQHGDF